VNEGRTYAAPGLGTRVLLRVIGAYKHRVSPFLGKNCRYYPTCSSYTMEALEIHGFWCGLWLGARRISRCHPLHEGGIDPVPTHGRETRDVQHMETVGPRRKLDQ
jgi:uncharacterized protein